MAWEARGKGQHEFYYRSRRRGGKVEKVYLGRGDVAREVVENLLVDGAGGDEHEAPNPGTLGCLDQLHGAEDVLLHELQHVTLATPEAVTGIVQGRMDHGIAAIDEAGTSDLVSQFAWHPLDLPLQGLKSAPVAAGAIPAPAEVPLGGEARRETM